MSEKNPQRPSEWLSIIVRFDEDWHALSFGGKTSDDTPDSLKMEGSGRFY